MKDLWWKFVQRILDKQEGALEGLNEEERRSVYMTMWAELGFI